MKILAIETSCDETSIAIIEASGSLKTTPKFRVLKNLITSQIELHRKFGGVVPNLAKREHLINLPLLLQKLSVKSKLSDVDAVAVTIGPGLEPALWTGINFAEDLSRKLNKPLLGANHLEGHLYSTLLKNNKKTILYPAIALIVSGGHTILLLLESLTKWKKIGETRDDAAGEAYDKVARLLDLPYPGGPEIEKLSKLGDKNAINLPRPMLHQKNYDFSFSGLKTSVLYRLRDMGYYKDPSIRKSASTRIKKIPQKIKNDIAASFQNAVVEVLTKKVMKAAEKFKARTIFLSGGVASNRGLRNQLNKLCREHELKLLVPDFAFNTDNAAMIGAAAYINTLKKSESLKKEIKSKYKIEAQGGLNL